MGVRAQDGPSTTRRCQSRLVYEREQERLSGTRHALSVLFPNLLLSDGRLLLHRLKHEKSLLGLLALHLSNLLLLYLTQQQLVLLLELRLLTKMECRQLPLLLLWGLHH